ncbi:MAG: alginate export family protein [Myxococcota bacterium]
MRAAALAASLLLLPVAARAAQTDPNDLDLALYRDGGSSLRPTVSADYALFFESNAYLGKDVAVVGAPVGIWQEFALTPGLDGTLALESAGSIFARVSGAGAMTRSGLDAAGSNLEDRNPERFALEDAYVGWRSGDLLESLGRDALEISVGKQPYEIGTGFLMWTGASNGGSRGAFWLGPRRAFYMSAIAKLDSGPWTAELFYLRPNDEFRGGTELAGANFEYTAGDFGKLGVSYFNIYHSKQVQRDGMNAVDWRLDTTPLPSARAFSLNGELAVEVNGATGTGWSWWLEPGYAFETCPGAPFASYRYSYFSGDRASSANRFEAFDPLFYGDSDWSTWYIGEIIGEFVTVNRNGRVHTLRLRLEPTESLTVNLLYSDYSLDQRATEIVVRDQNPRAANISAKHLGQEFDLISDWNATGHLSFTVSAAAFDPASGARQYVGTTSHSWWTQFMLSAHLEFE